MYRIHFDHEHRILHVAPWGVWTLAVHAKFAAQVLATAIPARVRYGSIAVLGDLREHPIQPAELNGPSAALIGKAVRMNNGPMAFVVGSMLGKFQADRVLAPPSSRIFLDFDDAQRWLRDCWIDQGYVFRDHARQSVR